MAELPVIIVGGGIAGLSLALRIAPVLPVTLVVAPNAVAATTMAQGGIAAAIGDGDTPALHASDTLAAGAGLTDPDTARYFADAAPAAVAWLAAQGVPFDRDTEHAWLLGREASHSRHRVVHAGGDRTGAAILATLWARVEATPAIQLLAGTAISLVTNPGGAVIGVGLQAENNGQGVLFGRAVVLATGGVGGLYRSTTNPVSARGTGLALAATAGAVLRDLEFVQFHPTAMVVGGDPLPLVTEALRGAGAVLINGRGERFMAEVAGADLAPRDVVAKAVHMQLMGGEAVFLDARHARVKGLGAAFPGTLALCQRVGLDPERQPIPVRPAAHYHMGGVKVDLNGRTTLPGLWASGEVASTGLHGANRLASNSLSEAVSLGAAIAEDIFGQSEQSQRPVEAPESAGDGIAGPVDPKLRALMDMTAGVVREQGSLALTAEQLWNAATDAGSSAWPRRDALVATLIVFSALRRRESIGAHQRIDEEAISETPMHSEITLHDVAAELGSPRASALAAAE